MNFFTPFFMHQTMLTHGNLSSYTSKLESKGYIEVMKEFVDKKPHTMLHLSDTGWDAFWAYRKKMIQVLTW